MSSTSHRFILVIVLLGFLGASTADAADAPHQDSHVRTTNREIAGLLRQATLESAFFRSLVDRLNASDVVVYVKTAGRLPEAREGQLTFIGQGGGLRYVVVSLAWGRPEVRLMATLGHELRHAVEIADQADIVDAASLARVYAGIGFSTIRGGPTVTFDTRAARQAGDQVYAEITRGGGRVASIEPALEARR